VRNTAWTLVGALVVFLTYVVKEIFRERLKNISESLTSTENIYTIHQDTDVLWEKLMSLESQLAALGSQGGRADPASSANIAKLIQRNAKTLSERVSNASIMFDQTSRLLDKLPSRQRHLRSERDRLAIELEDMKKAVKATETAVGHTATGAGSADPLKTLTELAQQSLPIVQAGLVQIKIAVLSDQVLETARSARKGAETLYTYCTWASYLLYAIGFTLALLAQLRGAGEIFKTG